MGGIVHNHFVAIACGESALSGVLLIRESFFFFFKFIYFEREQAGERQREREQERESQTGSMLLE